jgi:hypothetical protein
MKSIKYIALLCYCAISLSSCDKEGLTTAPPEPPGPASGQEFIFSNLVWYDNEMDNVYCSIVDYHLFRPSWRIDVSVKNDTTGVWLQAVNARENSHANGYLYSVSNQGSLYIRPNPPDTSLRGTRVSIKIKFL